MRPTLDVLTAWVGADAVAAEQRYEEALSRSLLAYDIADTAMLALRRADRKPEALRLYRLLHPDAAGEDWVTDRELKTAADSARLRKAAWSCEARSDDQWGDAEECAFVDLDTSAAGSHAPCPQSAHSPWGLVVFENERSEHDGPSQQRNSLRLWLARRARIALGGRAEDRIFMGRFPMSRVSEERGRFLHQRRADLYCVRGQDPRAGRLGHAGSDAGAPDYAGRMRSAQSPRRTRSGGAEDAENTRGGARDGSRAPTAWCWAQLGERAW
jgi:hypothetical protein